MSILFYKKPDYSAKNGALSESSCQRYVERAANSRAAIPEELSFRNVVEDRCLPPCSLQDFLDYLIYVSHDGENLQFYLWYKDYCKRFNTAPGWKKDMSPLWTETANQPRAESRTIKRKSRLSARSPSPAPQAKPLPSAPSPAAQFKEFSFQQHKEPLLKAMEANYSEDSLMLPVDIADGTSQLSVDEEQKAKQPFREEIERIADHYLRVGAPRELNLSSKERDNALNAVDQTTHPTALLEVASLIETTLRYHSHRNFVRWSICNGNKPRVFVLRSLAIFVLSCALALSFFLILSHYSRWLRLTVIPIIYFASVNLIAARQGLCVLLHRRRTREARPWEIDDPQPMSFARNENLRSLESGDASRGSSKKRASFGPKNDFDHEPWVHKWEKRSAWQKIRIQKIKVGPGGLRILQDKILLQAELWGAIVTVVYVAVICAFPPFGLY